MFINISVFIIIIIIIIIITFVLSEMQVKENMKWKQPQEENHTWSLRTKKMNQSHHLTQTGKDLNLGMHIFNFCHQHDSKQLFFIFISHFLIISSALLSLVVLNKSAVMPSICTFIDATKLLIILVFY